MKRVGFSVYDLPGDNQASCARPISSDTKNMQEVCEYINECCSHTSSDIKGVLDALSNYIGRQLPYRYSEVEENKTEFTVSVNGVNFRCAPELKEKVKDCRPKKAKRENETKTSKEERKIRMLEFLKSHRNINVSDYAALNQCTYYTAQSDIKKLEEEGYIQQEGYRTHRVYLLTEKGTEAMEKTPSPSEPLPERVRIMKMKLL